MGVEEVENLFSNHNHRNTMKSSKAEMLKKNLVWKVLVLEACRGGRVRNNDGW
jgi:hypothetical protein